MVEPPVKPTTKVNGNLLSSSLTENGYHGKSKISPLVMSSLLLPQINLSDSSLSPKQEDLLYDYKVLPRDFWKNRNLEENLRSDDVVYIGVTLRTLKRLQVYHGGWVLISAAQPKGPSHLGRVVSLEMASRYI
jgi:hypothetical protein